MKKFIAKRIEDFPEYVFSRLAKVVADVEKSSGRKVLSFGAGSPDVQPSKIYIDKLAEFIRQPDAHLYPGYGAIPQLAEALIVWHKRRFNVDLSHSELLPLLGAKDGISHIPLALVDEGDEVLVPDPGYPGFTGPSLMMGVKLVTYNLLKKNNFKLDLAELERKVTSKTKFIWVNFPSNPTGQVATLEELERIIEWAKKRKVFVVFDNAYSEITFDGFIAPSILQVPGAKNIAIEIGSFSKSFSFAGFRMGWVVGNAEVIAALAKVKSQMDSGMSIPLQKMGAFALTNPDKNWHNQMIKSYEERRSIIAKRMKSLGFSFSLPKGSLYIWVKIKDSGISSEEFCMKLLKEKQVLLTPGSAFGKNGEGFVRVSICVNIDKIDEYLKA